MNSENLFKNHKLMLTSYGAGFAGYNLYHNAPKFLDRQAWANSVVPDQTDQGLHWLLFELHHLDTTQWLNHFFKLNGDYCILFMYSYF